MLNARTMTVLPQMFRYWGKADPAYAGESKWHPLVFHCLDVAAVGVEYLRRAPHIRAYLMRALGIESVSTLEGWIAFWLALHDLGKFSEAFQSQRPDLFQELRGQTPNDAMGYRLRHDSLGMLFWRDVLSDHAVDKQWFGPNTEMTLDGLDFWMRAVTGHHGQPPSESSEFWEQHFDRKQDRLAILEFVSEIRLLLVDDAIAVIPSAQSPDDFHKASMELSWWIAGLAVLADWLGSNTEYFPYCSISDHRLPLCQYWKQAAKQAVGALNDAGVSPVRTEHTLSFRELFPSIANPSPLQEWVSERVLKNGPQIYLLEDVTGAGKTEAAVTLAHRLMAAGCADGFFIGLPTMATANAMYGRIAQVYAKLFADNASLSLAHGQRNLVEAFAASVVPPGPGRDDPQQADETATARCTAWLADHNKRALLAPAGVGTLDQALLAVLHSRHQSLRLLGLFRKVLVVDEVHACDAYMQSVLESLLEFHARAGGSAVLLSATLPQRMKQALLNAFARGCHATVPVIADQAFPLVTQWQKGSPSVLVESALATRPDVRRTLGVQYVSSTGEVHAAIEVALKEGKCVCWMRNTVADAMLAYAKFKDRLPAEKLTLFHARFALNDRLRTERKVLALFGKRSSPARRGGRLVIATQVAEQSLDADWDFVVSDLAPIDRLIQRAGRLQRHARDRRGRRLRDPAASDERGKPCLWVLGPEWVDDPSARWFKAAFPSASGVYPNHGQLWLTAKLLRPGHIVMPDDARHLIESVFGQNATIPEGLESNTAAAEGRGFADASIAQQNTVKLATGYMRGGIDWWSEAKTPSRLGEASANVLLACWEGDQLRPWAPGTHGWAYSSIRVPERLISRTAEPSAPVRRTAIEQLLQTLPNKGRWSVLLPLEKTPQGWIGTAWSAPARQKAEQLLTWVYDSQMGLRQIAAAALQEESE
jgi:CRISPR-associated endonuclease/helicase Cas3